MPLRKEKNQARKHSITDTRVLDGKKAALRTIFRRIIAAEIPKGEFCNHKVNYCPEHTSKLPLRFVLGLLNSLLADWYFRLGSTNAAVSHYQNIQPPLSGVPGEG